MTATYQILIADDESDMVELISYVLEKAGYAVASAQSGLVALEKALEIKPDLILLDVMLPELDGVSVCEYLRRTPETARIPVLMLTGCATDEARRVGLEAGANAYVIKPFRFADLLERVRRLLPQRSPKAS